MTVPYCSQRAAKGFCSLWIITRKPARDSLNPSLCPLHCLYQSCSGTRILPFCNLQCRRREQSWAPAGRAASCSVPQNPALLQNKLQSYQDIMFWCVEFPFCFHSHTKGYLRMKTAKYIKITWDEIEQRRKFTIFSHLTNIGNNPTPQNI